MSLTIPLEPVTSSQLDSIGHDAATNTLAVRFKAKNGPGSLYHYQQVTPEQFSAMKAAESPNSWFIHNIKKQPDAHPYEKIIETV